MERASQLERGALEGLPRRLLHRGRKWNPDVWLVDTEQGPLVWKDFAPRSRWVRWLWGPWSTRREVRAYRALAGHPAVPRFVAVVDSLSFLAAYQPGRPLSRRVRRHLRPEFFDDLFLRLTNDEPPRSRMTYPIKAPNGAVYWVLTRDR